MNQLPSGWVITTLDEVTLPVGMVDTARTADRDIQYIDIGGIDNIRNRIAETKSLRLSAAPSRARQVVKSGDVVFATVRPYLRNIALVTDHLDNEIASTGFAVLRAAHGVEPKYLFYKAISRDFVASLTGEQYGVSYPAVKDGHVRAQSIELAPTNEQRRIVAKVEELFSELDKAVESLIRARELLKAYRQAVLKAAFEGELTAEWRRRQPKLPTAFDVMSQARASTPAPTYKRKGRATKSVENAAQPVVPDNWGVLSLGDLDVEVFDGPFGSHLKTSDYVDAGVRVIRLENIGHGHFIEEKRSFVNAEKYEELKNHTVVPGNLVVSSFVTDAIRSAIVPTSVPIAVNKADCFAIRFRGDALLVEFAQRFLESRSAYKQLESMIHGVGRPRINTSQLKQVVLPICSLAEQLQVISALSAAYSAIDTLNIDLDTQMEKVTALRQSVLKCAFSGRLVEHDPADEPASVLLERIRADKQPGKSGRRNPIKRRTKTK